MVRFLVALLIVLVLGVLGFALHLLWWIAIAALVLWLAGFLLRTGESAPRKRGRG
jgi:hypothetical protein